jgi:hypothetical protein
LTSEFGLTADQVIDGFSLVEAQLSIQYCPFSDLTSFSHSHFHLFQFLKDSLNYSFAAMQVKLNHIFLVVAD